MATAKAWTDLQGREITQFAYDQQKAAGTNVSGYKPITTATPAPTKVTPVVTPTTPTGVTTPTPTQLQKDMYTKMTPAQKANFDAKNPNMAGAFTQTAPVAPVKPVTPVVVKPVEVKPVLPAGQREGAAGQPVLLPVSDYQDDSQARQTDIVANLNNARMVNPNSLSNYKTFKNYYNYDGRSDLQKKTLDNWFQGYERGQALSGATVDNIYRSYASGKVTQTDLENLRLSNEVKYNEVKNLINKKDTLASYEGELYGTGAVDGATANPFQKIIDSFTSNLQNYASSTNIYDEYKSAMNTAEMKAMTDDLANRNGQIAEIDKELANIQSEVEKRYEGTGASKTKINQIVADEGEDLQSRRSSLAIDYNTELSKYNSATALIKDNFDLQLKKTAEDRAVRNQQMSEIGFATTLMNFETNKQKDDRAWNTFIRQQEYQDGNIYSTDPATRRKAVQKAVEATLTEFAGIPMIRSAQEMQEDIQKLVDGGMSLGDAITKNIREPIKKKPEYQIWLSNKLGLGQNAFQLAGFNYQLDMNGNLSQVSTSTGTGMSGAGARNNNPGNIKDTTFGSPVGVDAKGFAIFANADAGFDALVEKIKYNQTNPKSAYYGKTIAQYIAKYAPASDNNNPGAYAADVAAKLGVSVNTPISQLDSIKFAAAIAKHDSGYDYSSYGKVGATAGNAPSAVEQMYFANKKIDATGKEGITQQRYNEIASYNATTQTTNPTKYTADEMLTGIELPEKMSGPKALSFSYGNRMNKSDEQIKKYEDIFQQRSGAGQLRQEVMPQFLKSSDQKSYNLYKKNWITASLRQESGAAIADSEYANEETKYFAQPGDSADVVAQKRAMRQYAEYAMYVQAGNDANGVPISSYYNYTPTQQDGGFSLQSLFPNTNTGGAGTVTYDFNTLPTH